MEKKSWKWERVYGAMERRKRDENMCREREEGRGKRGVEGGMYILQKERGRLMEVGDSSKQ